MKPIDVITIGRSSVDLYGVQVGGRLEDMGSFQKYIGGSPTNMAAGTARLGLRSALITRVGENKSHGHIFDFFLSLVTTRSEPFEIRRWRRQNRFGRALRRKPGGLQGDRTAANRTFHCQKLARGKLRQSLLQSGAVLIGELQRPLAKRAMGQHGYSLCKNIERKERAATGAKNNESARYGDGTCDCLGCRGVHQLGGGVHNLRR